MLPFASLVLAGVADVAWGRPAPGRLRGWRAFGPALVAVCLVVVVVAPQW